MGLNAEEEPQNAWLTRSRPWKINTWRSVCVWGGDSNLVEGEESPASEGRERG